MGEPPRLSLNMLSLSFDAWVVLTHSYNSLEVGGWDGESKVVQELGGGLTSGELTNQDGKEGEAEGRLVGWRAEGPGQFNGPFVCAVRPPALTGCCRKTSHTRAHAFVQTCRHTSCRSFHISPSLYLFHCWGLYTQLQCLLPFTKAQTCYESVQKLVLITLSFWHHFLIWLNIITLEHVIKIQTCFFF